jgi:predicted PurR-regulated permease PerM
MNALAIKKVTLYLVILALGILLVWQLYYFVPAFLLSLSLYVLWRNIFFNLVNKRRWKKWLASLALIFLTVLILAVPIWIIIEILIPKVRYLVINSPVLLQKATIVINELKAKFPKLNISNEQVQGIIRQGMALAPGILGTTAGIITNLLASFFILHFMFAGGEAMEQKLSDFLPLKPSSKTSIWEETHKLIVSNAIGIPILAFLQAIIASIGYRIFDIDDYMIWGLMTGVCSLLPVVGTMIVWVPIVVYLFAINEIGPAIGLALYCAVIVSNIDNVLRFTLMRKIGDVHPLITVFGVIVGLKLFGILGLIFGPLLLSYFMLLLKIYKEEFKEEQ